MGGAPSRYIAWFERQGHPCMISSLFLSVCPRICIIQLRACKRSRKSTTKCYAADKGASWQQDNNQWVGNTRTTPSAGLSWSPPHIHLKHTTGVSGSQVHAPAHGCPAKGRLSPENCALKPKKYIHWVWILQIRSQCELAFMSAKRCEEAVFFRSQIKPITVIDDLITMTSTFWRSRLEVWTSSERLHWCRARF